MIHAPGLQVDNALGEQFRAAGHFHAIPQILTQQLPAPPGNLVREQRLLAEDVRPIRDQRA